MRIHEVNPQDYKRYSREDICNMIRENRTEYSRLLGEKWNLKGADLEENTRKRRELEVEEMKLQLILEEMDEGRL